MSTKDCRSFAAYNLDVGRATAICRRYYLPEESKVIYRSKACPQWPSGNGKDERVFDALEWLAAMGSHVLDKGEQMVNFKPTLKQSTR
jgi:hypothetical protein